jgi:hypothetical protein
MNEAGWKEQIENMVLRGAQIGPNDIEKAAAYLAENFGPGVPFPNQNAAEVKLPDGPGQMLVEGGCGGLCHGLDRVVAANRPGQQWRVFLLQLAIYRAEPSPTTTNGAHSPG